MRHRLKQGVTLVEMLVALAIFGIVMAIAYAAINGSLQIQSDQEAATTTQGKLRRVVEVLTQDLRSAVFGSITNAPYASDNNQVSFMMLTGGAGYTVLSPGSLTTFPVEGSFRVQIADGRPLVGRDVVMINSTTGEGVVRPITGARSDGANVWILESSCRNTLEYDLNNMLIFEVATIGMRFDAETNRIMVTEGGLPEASFAFDVSDFRIEYVYSSGAAAPETRTTPVLGDEGVPVRTYVDDGELYTLQRVQFVVAADAESRGRVVPHAYTGQVDLSRTEHFTVEEILPCD